MATKANVRIAAAGAIASHHLAVSAPRSFGVLVAGVSVIALSLAAHRAWGQLSDIRSASLVGVNHRVAQTGGRVGSLGAALVCEIVNLYVAPATPRIAPVQLRRCTRVNALSLDVFEPELPSLATVVREAELPRFAACLVAGRQFDKLTVFAADGAPLAAPAV
ncbi:MAG TPA: hypothetical protein VFP84_39670 [Kofleriaceae bacterium]|nr:hypothetical protein [Kofleriaceae bacterium]